MSYDLNSLTQKVFYFTCRLGLGRLSVLGKWSDLWPLLVQFGSSLGDAFDGSTVMTDNAADNTSWAWYLSAITESDTPQGRPSL